MFVSIDTAAFEQNMHELLNAMDSMGANAFKRTLDDAATSTNEFGYQNRTGKLTASRQTALDGHGALKWSGFIKWRAPYSVFVDKPTKPHRITAHGKALRWYVHGVAMFAKSVMHPGTKGAGFSVHAEEMLDRLATPNLEHAIDSSINRHQ